MAGCNYCLHSATRPALREKRHYDALIVRRPLLLLRSSEIPPYSWRCLRLTPLSFVEHVFCM